MTNPRRTQLRDEATAIFRAALAAVDPARLAANALSRQGDDVVVALPDGTVCRWRQPTLVVGAGKAAARMAAGCEQALGAAPLHGEVIVPDGCAAPLQPIAVTEAGHPLPDLRGERATRRLLESVGDPRANGILCLISGGASSLLVAPRPPVRLPDKIRATQLLLECGADISEINTVRKHLSAVKGGGFLRQVRAPMVALLISDVIGDEISTIGSGPTCTDITTFSEAWDVVTRYHLTDRLPATVVSLLQQGVQGLVPETVKPDEPQAGRCRNLIVGSNRTALDGAAEEARRRGWSVIIEQEPIAGDTTAAARSMGARLRQRIRQLPKNQAVCVLVGGETTVRVRGRGRGGRNQEFALAIAGDLAGNEVLLLSAGTDGVDGPTNAAGAFADGTTLRRASERGLDPQAALTDNDSHSFFSRLGDLLECGPTGTNVMDIKITLLPAAAP